MYFNQVIIEKDSLKYDLAKRLKQYSTTSIDYKIVKNYKEEVSFSDCISNIKSTILVTDKNGYSIQKMGSETGNPACDYDLEFIYGCPHHCIYCQQLYSIEEAPFIEIYPDIQTILNKIKDIVEKEAKNHIVFEAGNMTDLLAMEQATGSLKEMIPFFAQKLKGRASLHFLTKSNNVKEIIHLNPEGKVRIGFSINLTEIQNKYELKTSTILERMKAIKEILKTGYKLHLSFSPIIYRKGILKEYDLLLKNMKQFLLSCDGYQEENLNIEGLIFFQKKGGEKIIRKHYPKISDDLMQYFIYTYKGKEKRYCYEKNIYNKLLSFLKESFNNYFPKAKVLFIN